MEEDINVEIAAAMDLQSLTGERRLEGNKASAALAISAQVLDEDISEAVEVEKELVPLLPPEVVPETSRGKEEMTPSLPPLEDPHIEELPTSEAVSEENELSAEELWKIFLSEEAALYERVEEPDLTFSESFNPLDSEASDTFIAAKVKVSTRLHDWFAEGLDTLSRWVTARHLNLEVEVQKRRQLCDLANKAGSKILADKIARETAWAEEKKKLMAEKDSAEGEWFFFQSEVELRDASIAQLNEELRLEKDAKTKILLELGYEQAEKSRLRRELTDAKKSFEEERAQLKADLVVQRSSAESASVEASQLKKSVESAQAEITELKEKSLATRATLSVTLQENGRLDDALRVALDDFKKAQEEVKRLRTEFGEPRQEPRGVYEQLLVTSSKLKEIQGKYEAKKAEVQRLRGQLSHAPSVRNKAFIFGHASGVSKLRSYLLANQSMDLANLNKSFYAPESGPLNKMFTYGRDVMPDAFSGPPPPDPSAGSSSAPE